MTQKSRVSAFNGTINFIKNHVPEWVKILKPITRLTKKEMKLEWGDKQQKAFKKIKMKEAESIMLVCPNLNKPFIIYTDASNYAPGGIVTQYEQVISCFSKKFKEAQIKYLTTEQELLTIAETLKYHHNIIYGGEIIVKTDHKNLAHDTAQHTSKHVLHQHLLIDQEYMAKIVYYEGSLNLGADGLSRIEQDDSELTKCKFELYAIQAILCKNDDHFPLNLWYLKTEQLQDKQLPKLKNDTMHSKLMRESDIYGTKVMMYKNLI